MTRRAQLRGVGAAVLVVVTAACSDFLEVSDPGRFTDEALNAANALKAVANGVEGDLWGAYDDFATFGGLMTDELMHTGTWAQWEDMDLGRQGPGFGTDNGVHSSLLQRRVAAQNAQDRFNTVMGDTANRAELMARVIAVEGWVNLLMGMHACEAPREPDGAIVPDLDLFRLAIPLFDQAITIAKAAGSSNYERMALAGRARAKLFTNDLAGAATDAAQIPDSYVYAAKFSETGVSNSITSFAHYTRLKAGGLDTRKQALVDTVAKLMRDPFHNELDPRLPFTRQGNGADGVKKFYNQEKFKTLSDDVIMASGWEMRLIEAEVHMRGNRLVEAVNAINKVRANAKLTLHSTDGLDANKVRDYLLWERFAQLYLEGHRMHDLARFNLVASVMGTGRAPKFPMDGGELQLNPNTNGSTSGRCPAMT
jgi:hypothetical protein